MQTCHIGQNLHGFAYDLVVILYIDTSLLLLYLLENQLIQALKQAELHEKLTRHSLHILVAQHTISVDKRLQKFLKRRFVCQVVIGRVLHYLHEQSVLVVLSEA